MSALERTRILFVGLDADARLRLFNQEAERVTGFAREDALGKPFAELLLPDDLRDNHGALLRDIAAGRRTGTDALDSVIRTRGGKRRDVRWQITYDAPDAEDDVVLFAVGQDVTEGRAQARRERRREKIDVAGRLVAGLAHELRNPLNGAHLHATLLERALRSGEIRSEDAMDHIEIIRGEIHRLSQLVTEFLGFARPQLLLFARTALCAVLERAALVVQQDAAAVGVTVKTDLPAPDVVVDLDAAKVEQAIVNLLRNAVESLAPAGTGVVELRGIRRGDRAVIEVHDDGPGVLSKDMPIFEPFFTTKVNGTGLGLSVVQRVVADHDGTVEVTSRPGRTVFRITLPLRPRSASQGHGRTTTTRKVSGNRRNRARRRS